MAVRLEAEAVVAVTLATAVRLEAEAVAEALTAVVPSVAVADAAAADADKHPLPCYHTQYDLNAEDSHLSIFHALYFSHLFACQYGLDGFVRNTMPNGQDALSGIVLTDVVKEVAGTS